MYGIKYKRNTEIWIQMNRIWKKEKKKIPNGNYQLAKVSIGHLKKYIDIDIDKYRCI